MSDYPVFRVKQLLEERDRLLRAAINHYQGQALGPDLLANLARQLHEELPGRVPYDAIYETLRPLLGQTLAGPQSLLLAWRLAGNLPQLVAGHPVHPWTAQRTTEWVPVQVLRAVPQIRERDKARCALYTLRVLAGSPAGLKITVLWKLARASLVASYLGFTAPWGKCPYHHYTELVGLRFLGKLDPARSRDMPYVDEIGCPGALLKWNKDNVLRYRQRGEHLASGTNCPRRFAGTCHNCAIGYGECPAGTHRETYTMKQCPGCGNQDALFDPEERAVNCRDCVRKQSLARTTP